jgi:hypothetical protein
VSFGVMWQQSSTYDHSLRAIVYIMLVLSPEH